MHKSEDTRQILKWTLLCASTKECINPDDSKLLCPDDRTLIAACHRFDQSVLGILSVNSEYQRFVINNGNSYKIRSNVMEIFELWVVKIHPFQHFKI
uniref:Uncharacterized protein n=1 Tax=Meloidogyne incognita TaxID=6306 RepID=A0A914M3Y6_MELIC